MARPREFDEGAVLDAAALCFWKQGYEATSVRDLVAHTGITAASLYNAFGDKRALYQRALDHYVEASIADRIRRCEVLPPLQAIEKFFADIVQRSLNDRDRKGCMLVNAALDVAPHDPAFRKVVAKVLIGIEAFFLACVRAGQRDGTITRSLAAETLSQNLLGVLMGIRVLARVRPERSLLEGVAAPALALLRVEPEAIAASAE
jgi:TetR/AcrR family transcriptional repressor of nem operon